MVFIIKNYSIITTYFWYKLIYCMLYNGIYMWMIYNNLSVTYTVNIVHIRQLPEKHNNQMQITYLLILLTLKT